MTNYDKFKKLATALGRLSGRSHGDAWDDAQVLKNQVRKLISDVFADEPSVRDRLLGRLSGVFAPSPSCAVNGEFITSSSEFDAQHDFENDIATAKDIMDDSCRELERLSAKYR